MAEPSTSTSELAAAWDTDDAGVLEAALEFIETFDSPPTPTRSGSKRNRLQEELAVLRERVTKLEAELEATRPRTSQSLQSALWQDVAERQQKLRTQAKIENARLRLLLRKELALARRLAKTAKRGVATDITE